MTRGCTGKTPYDTDAKARRAIRALYRKGKGEALKPYLCVCGAYHVGRDPKDRQHDDRLKIKPHYRNCRRNLVRRYFEALGE